MKTKTILLSSFIFLASTLVPTAGAQEEASTSWSGNITGAFFSDYMWRGFRLYDGEVFQPSVSGSYDLGEFGSLSGSVWSSIVVESQKDANRFTEVDYTLSWSKQFDPVTLTLGHIWYTFPHDPADVALSSEEIYAQVAFNLPLAPVITVYNDYRAFDNVYYELALSHSFDGLVAEDVSVAPFTVFGFAESAEKVYERDGLVQVTSGLNVSATLGDLVITPNLSYGHSVDANTVHNFWTGVSVAYKF